MASLAFRFYNIQFRQGLRPAPRRGTYEALGRTKLPSTLFLREVSHSLGGSCPNLVQNSCSAWWWLGSLVVRASDLRLNGREFDPRPPYYRSVGTETILGGHTTLVCNQPPGLPSLLPSVGRKMNTDQSALMRCGWE